MKVNHYFEWEEWITGGHSESVRNQRKIMDRRGIDYTTSPDLDSDIIHLNNMGPRSVQLARKAREKDIPVLVHAHQTAEDFRNSFALSNIIAKPLKPYLSYAYSLADRLICPSEHNRRVIEEYTDVPKMVISNGFDPEKLEGYENLRQEYLERYELEPPVVFMVGHVIERKGLETFIETAEEMTEVDFAWFGYLNPAGEGRKSLLQRRKTRKLVEESPDNCVFTGYVEDIRGAYAAGDIFFFPTRNENEGMALLEAMACGKPVLVRDIETFEWLEDGVNCLKTAENFGEKLEELKEEKLQSRLGQKAKEKSKEFRLGKVGDELVEVYRELKG
ncbi:MAG: glycosyltransferase family 4 protein [Candidatus Nanohaloarchaea archaeon]